MNCASNIITANFSGGKTHATTARVYQWSRGIELCITGADNLPQTFKAHFSVQKRGGVATTIVGIDERVDVPNVLFTIGKDIHVWLGASETEDDAEILYTVDIPVAPAPMPEYYDAEDTGVFDAVVEQVADYAATATAAANSAGASATAAAGSASAAAASASSAAGSAGAAEQARADAVTAKGQAETAAQTATEKAQQTAQNASQAASDAGRAESAAERAESAETGAGAAKTAAEAAAQNAAASAATADEKATLAGQSATAAAGSASAAAQSAASIEGDVQIASQKASEATTAAGQAVTAKDAAVTARQGAETAATNAGQSASTATTKATEAAQSASNAAQSKTDAEAAAARAEQAAASLTVDSALSDSSTNPVQNKVITGEITDVKTALDELNSYTKVGFNLFDISKLERDKRLSIDSGNAVDYEGYSCTDFIPLTHDYPRVRSSLQPDRLVIYNASKEKIEVHSSYYSQSIESASYIRFCYADATTDYNSLMIAYTSEIGNKSVNTWSTIFPNMGYVPYLADTNEATFKSSKMTEQEETTGAYALVPVAKMANHFMMPNGMVSSSTSNDWEVYAYKVENNAEYIIKTFVNTTTATGTTKTFYAIIDKAISGYISYAAENILETSEQMGGSVLGVAYNQRYHERRIRISNSSAKTLIVVRGKLGGSQFPTIVVPVVADKDIKYNLTLDDLKDFATVENGVYTFSSSFTLRVQNSGFNLPKIVKTRAKYTGEQPTIQFRQGNIYLSNAFDIGSADQYIDQSWRVPAPTEEHVNVQMIVTIPSDSTLSLKAFTMTESDKTEKYGYGTQLNAHLGFYGMYPENTMVAFYGAYENGYPACITVPKVTADNKLVCFHDDASITRTLRNADGTAIAEDKAISSLTYSQILEYDAGRYFNIIYAGEKVPLLSDFFRFCAMTGTKPILSTHPALPISAWEEIKDLCQKYGILEKLNVKSFTLSILQTAHSVLGDAIDGYTLDTSGVTNYESTIASLVGLGIETKKTVEWDDANVTREAIEATLNAGCTCAIWNVARKSGARYKELISWGVTEFTDDYNCNFGLLW